MTVGRKYSEYVHGKADYWGTYPPMVPLAVGDLLQITKDSSFKPLGSTTDWPGWREALPTLTLDAPGAMTHSAHASRAVGSSASAQAPVVPALDVNASVTLSFSQAAGFVMELQPDRLHRYRDILAAKKRVAARVKNGDWDADWVLVAEVMHVASATIAISLEKGSSVVLTAKAALPQSFNLADVNLGLQATNTTGSSLVVVAQECTPLFRCLKISKKWFGRHTVELQGADDVPLDEAFLDDPFSDDV